MPTCRRQADGSAVCGDVGFGKTEVALRAAFVAIADRKQVARALPTTLLAEQHLQTFADRFATGRCASRSCRVSGLQGSEQIVQHSSGEWTSDIGTHKLLARDMKFSA